MKRSIELASPPSPKLRWKKKEGRKYFLSLLPALAVAAFFSFAFNSSEKDAEINTTPVSVLGVYDLEYINDSGCSFKLQVYTNGNPCATTVGTVDPGTSSINYSLPCSGSLTGVRLIGQNGAPDVPSTGAHPCTGDGTAYGPFLCGNNYEFTFGNCKEVRIEEV